MTKANLQKELLSKVKPGTKPSDIKGLKRSKSANDINANPEQEAFLKELWLLLHPATKSLPLDQPIDQEALKSALKSQLNELKTLKTSPPQPLLAEQLKAKQAQIESLRQQLETSHNQLTTTQAQLDQSLAARHQSLTTFASEHEKRQQAQQELDQTINEASAELVKGDQANSVLRTQLFQANQQINSLQRELNLARIHKHSPSPSLPSFPNRLDSALNYTQYALYAWLALWFILLLTRSQPN